MRNRDESYLPKLPSLPIASQQKLNPPNQTPEQEDYKADLFSLEFLDQTELDIELTEIVLASWNAFLLSFSSEPTLPNLADPITPQQAENLRFSRATRSVFEKLYLIDNGAKVLFSSQKDQRIAFKGLIDAVTSTEVKFAQLVSLGSQHYQFGVTRRHYATFGCALISVIFGEKAGSTLSNEDDCNAWALRYSKVVDAMLKGSCLLSEIERCSIYKDLISMLVQLDSKPKTYFCQNPEEKLISASWKKILNTPVALTGSSSTSTKSGKNGFRSSKSHIADTHTLESISLLLSKKAVSFFLSRDKRLVDEACNMIISTLWTILVDNSSLDHSFIRQLGKEYLMKCETTIDIYIAIGVALLSVYRDILGDSFKPHTRKAWLCWYCIVSAEMACGASLTREPKPLYICQRIERGEEYLLKNHKILNNPCIIISKDQSRSLRMTKLMADLRQSKDLNEFYNDISSKLAELLSNSICTDAQIFYSMDFVKTACQSPHVCRDILFLRSLGDLHAKINLLRSHYVALGISLLYGFRVYLESFSPNSRLLVLTWYCSMVDQIVKGSGIVSEVWKGDPSKVIHKIDNYLFDPLTYPEYLQIDAFLQNQHSEDSKRFLEFLASETQTYNFCNDLHFWWAVEEYKDLIDSGRFDQAGVKSKEIAGKYLDRNSIEGRRFNSWVDVDYTICLAVLYNIEKGKTKQLLFSPVQRIVYNRLSLLYDRFVQKFFQKNVFDIDDTSDFIQSTSNCKNNEIDNSGDNSNANVNGDIEAITDVYQNLVRKKSGDTNVPKKKKRKKNKNRVREKNENKNNIGDDHALVNSYNSDSIYDNKDNINNNKNSLVDNDNNSNKSNVNHTASIDIACITAATNDNNNTNDNSNGNVVDDDDTSVNKQRHADYDNINYTQSQANVADIEYDDDDNDETFDIRKRQVTKHHSQPSSQITPQSLSQLPTSKTTLSGSQSKQPLSQTTQPLSQPTQTLTQSTQPLSQSTQPLQDSSKNSSKHGFASHSSFKGRRSFTMGRPANKSTTSTTTSTTATTTTSLAGGSDDSGGQNNGGSSKLGHSSSFKKVTAKISLGHTMSSPSPPVPKSSKTSFSSTTTTTMIPTLPSSASFHADRSAVLKLLNARLSDQTQEFFTYCFSNLEETEMHYLLFWWAVDEWKLAFPSSTFHEKLGSACKLCRKYIQSDAFLRIEFITKDNIAMNNIIQNVLEKLQNSLARIENESEPTDGSGNIIGSQSRMSFGSSFGLNIFDSKELTISGLEKKLPLHIFDATQNFALDYITNVLYVQWKQKGAPVRKQSLVRKHSFGAAAKLGRNKSSGSLRLTKEKKNLAKKLR